MNAETRKGGLPESRIGERWKLVGWGWVYEIVAGPCFGCTVRGDPVLIAKKGQYALRNIKTRCRWAKPGTLASIDKQLHSKRRRFVFDGRAALPCIVKASDAAEPMGVAI